MPNDPYHPSNVKQRVFDGRRDFGLPTDNHSVVNGRRLDAKHQPNSSLDLHDSDGLRQRRYYGKDGKAIEDIDYRHSNGDNSHTFPHRHDWTQTNKGEPRKVPEIKPHGIEGLDR